MGNFQEPEAIIYIPGLTQEKERDKSVETFAYRIKKAVDVNFPKGSSKFGIDIQKRSFGKDNKLECKVASIYKMEKQEKILIYDIYELDYNKELTQKFENQNILVKTYWLFNALVSKFPRLLYVFGKSSGLSLRDKTQIFIVSFILFCLSVYGITLVSAFAAAIGSKINFSSLPNPVDFIDIPGITMPKFMATAWDYVYSVFEWIFLVIGGILRSLLNLISAYKKYILTSAAAVLLFLPNLKNFVTNTATDYLCLINYFNIGDRRLTIIGKFEELLEYVIERDQKYSKISVYSYSYGSIIAMDTLFPYDGRTSERIKSEIHTLVTIGCPFDFIRAYWPNYYKNRRKPEIQLQKWYNIHSGIDVLSSNFRDDSEQKEATIHVAEDSILPVNIPYNVISPEDLRFSDMIMLLGLKAHAMYWDDTVYSASCLTNLFQEMKKDFLQGQKKIIHSEEFNEHKR